MEIRALTGVRIIFALMVVLFHFSTPNDLLGMAGLYEGPVWLSNLITHGHVGVQFFFVLSGFILALTYHVLAKEHDRAFYAARIARIYPVYLLGLAVMLPNIYLAVFKIDAEGMPPVLTFALQTIACALLLQAWIPRWALVGNAPGWSLSAEAFFYACFPRLMRTLREHGTVILILGLVMLVAVKLVVCWFGWRWTGMLDPVGAVTNEPQRAFWFNLWHFNPVVHLPEFISGMLAYVLLRRGVFPHAFLGWSTWIGVLLLGGILMSGVFPEVLIENGVLILPCVLLLIGLTVDSPLSRLLGHRIMLVLGQASYAVYLLHGPLMWYMEKLDKRVLHVGSTHPLLMVAVYLVVLLAISVAVFWWFEEPLRRRIRARLGGKRQAGQS